ncbi:acetylornithine deacetylase (ArgE) [Ancylobacter novellus DSM 506]|uniref:Acetylornithine deacetylase (ArgE) n=1 Tax=Ancylobacter novellus (strain ATCC 8093 / DSM 506 / JCM 20403 / CCM 1077 / IAM 12100 / NBRC 12443 / NCIMB 10456) TaxID=639283 RepID=D7A536_ANCN5|nr:acetylornithine deacetylase [Ancylobacter novellus]ADH89924.1 acetylornithine deacetylase (ArgE) [Ancylobacter novellus DSM 506]
MNTLELLDRLIAFPTVSRDPNRELIAFAQDFLAARGIEAQIVATPDGRKANLFATIGPADRPGIMLSGHTDVVPVEGQAWSSDPFRLRVEDGRAYGRGTADMKGFVAAALALAERTAGRELSTPLHLAFSHDEEVGCVGVRSLIERMEQAPVRPLMCIVGEPTSLRIATGHKGKLAARATCCGVEGHSALAPRALNAIHLACDFVGVLREQQDRLATEGVRDPDYDIPYTTVHAGVIGGGTALNIVPNRCTVDFEIRNIAQDDASQILNRLMDGAAKLVEQRKAAFPQADITVDVVNTYPGLATPPDAPIVDFVRLLVEDPATFKVAFGTEGGLFDSRLSIPTVICGPGSMDQGHKPDEFISLDQLASCDRMMDRLLDRLAA